MQVLVAIWCLIPPLPQRQSNFWSQSVGFPCVDVYTGCYSHPKLFDTTSAFFWLCFRLLFFFIFLNFFLFFLWTDEGSSVEDTDFNWDEFLEETGASAAPHTSFKHVRASSEPWEHCMCSSFWILGGSLESWSGGLTILERSCPSVHAATCLGMASHLMLGKPGCVCIICSHSSECCLCHCLVLCIGFKFSIFEDFNFLLLLIRHSDYFSYFFFLFIWVVVFFFFFLSSLLSIPTCRVSSQESTLFFQSCPLNA